MLSAVDVPVVGELTLYSAINPSFTFLFCCLSCFLLLGGHYICTVRLTSACIDKQILPLVYQVELLIVSLFTRVQRDLLSYQFSVLCHNSSKQPVSFM